MCAIVSALALIVACIALGESHPNIIAVKKRYNQPRDPPGMLLGMMI